MFQSSALATGKTLMHQVVSSKGTQPCADLSMIKMHFSIYHICLTVIEAGITQLRNLFKLGT